MFVTPDADFTCNPALITMLISLVARVTQIPWARKLLWKGWYQFLASKFERHDWSFMNYGYEILDPSEPAPVLEPADEPDRLCVQLYHRLAGPVVEGKDVLEVGSGRGGGASYVARYLKPKSMVGVDFSRNAVRLANRRFGRDNLRFVEGEASRLPFEDGSFDVVLNVESSHCYPSRADFFAEVARVLRPGGRFRFADLLTPDEAAGIAGMVAATGMKITAEEEITPNVIASLDRSHDMKVEYIGRAMSGRLERLFRSFAGVRGSEVYGSFKSGALVYRAYAIERP